jgi:hypothetical protein
MSAAWSIWYLNNKLSSFYTISLAFNNFFDRYFGTTNARVILFFITASQAATAQLKTPLEYMDSCKKKIFFH